jgi:hypothetical protein
MNGSGENHKSEVQFPQCYTAPLAQMSAQFRSRVVFLCLIGVLLSSAHAQDADPVNPYAKVASEFVAELMSRAGSPSLVSLATENRSEITPAEFAQIRAALSAQFRSVNVKVVKPERALAEIKVTVSQNSEGLLWVAETKQGLSGHVFMLRVPRANPSIAAVSPQPLTLRRASVFVQSDHQSILDFAIVDPNTLLVLTPEHLAIYASESGRWHARSTLQIRHAQPWPRDVRGRLVLQDAQMRLFLPGVRCTGPLDSRDPTRTLECMESDDPWPLTLDSGTPVSAFYATNRNNFTGLLTSAGTDQTVPAFYSASVIGENSGWVFANTDGRARYYASMKQQPMLLSGLGSELASIKSECGSKWQLLVTRTGDRTQSDAVQALEVVGREATPVSSPMEFSGPITALWPAQNHGSINAISKDLISGNYEASTLSVTCNR